MKALFEALLVVLFLLLCSPSLVGQSCLSRDEINQLMSKSNATHQDTLNKKLKAELVKMAVNNQDLLTELMRADDKKKPSLRSKLVDESHKSEARFCEILREYGWPTKELVEPEGVDASYEILRSNASYELQRDLLPIIVASLKRNEEQKPQFAALFDRLRVSAGMKQLFGTQAVVVNGFLVLYPIEDEKHVEDRREQFGLPPMTDNIRNLEREYQMPLVKARDIPDSQLSGGLQSSVSSALKSTVLDTPSVSEDDVIKTNTNLVNLNVSVFNEKLKAYVGELKKEDFKVFENNQEESISFFASTDVPFDLVLLLDLSGSTSQKRDVIRQSTKRFIEAARPSDRIAIVTFSDVPKVLSPLSDDRDKLMAAAHEIVGGGGTNVWDALKFSMDFVVGTPNAERRRAIVMMTDGADNSMGIFAGPSFGSKITYADLLEAVRRSDTLIVPIYLDTESDEPQNSWSKKMYANARRMLQALAEESGGSYYKARRVSDLNGVYEQVINDLGKIYSLGYKPTNDKRDATWRPVKVSIADRPDLVVHSRPGYYAK